MIAARCQSHLGCFLGCEYQQRQPFAGSFEQMIDKNCADRSSDALKCHSCEMNCSIFVWVELWMTNSNLHNLVVRFMDSSLSCFKHYCRYSYKSYFSKLN